MATEFDLSSHIRNAMSVIIAVVSIALAFGIGYYILVKLNDASGGNLTEAVNMLSSQTSLINTSITFLVIGVVAGIGIGLVVYLYSKFSGMGGK